MLRPGTLLFYILMISATGGNGMERPIFSSDSAKTCFLHAIETNNTHNIQEWLAKGFDPNQELYYTYPLFHALKSSPEVTRVLLNDSRTNPNVFSPRFYAPGQPLLIAALDKNRFDIAYLLCEHPAIKVNLVYGGKTAWDTFLKHYDPTHVIQKKLHALLIAKRAIGFNELWNATSLDMKLFNAVQEKNTKNIKDFLKQGAIPRAIIDKNHNTILHYAAAHTNEEIISLLVIAENNSFRPNIECVNQLGQTPLEVALQVGKNDIAQILLSHNCRLPVQPPAIPQSAHNQHAQSNAIQKKPDEELLDAVVNNNLNRIRELLALKVYVNNSLWHKKISRSSLTPLAAAVFFNHFEAMQLLLAHPTIDPNKGSSVRAPLHLAVDLGLIDIVKELLKHRNINPHLRTKDAKRLSAYDMCLDPEKNKSPWTEIRLLLKQPPGITPCEPQIAELRSHATEYEILGIPPSASIQEIKQAYKRKALKWHPDKNFNTELATTVFKRIQSSYEQLKKKRKIE